MTTSTLLAVPNVSEGRDAHAIREVALAFAGGGARVLDVHADPDHNRSVFTLAGVPGALAGAVLAGAREALARVDIRTHEGVHPRVGVIDVAPIVFLTPEDLGAACAEALVLADRLGEELEVPVFLYGVLAGERTRAELRRGGPDTLAERIAHRELAPDFGPPRLHPSGGATLVAARPPLVAFNVELAAPATLEDARAIAASIREGGSDGLPGVRAIGVWLEDRAVAQVSTNVEEPGAAPLRELVAAIGRHAEVREVELVGLAPGGSFDRFPPEIRVRNRRTIEEALDSSD